MKREVQPLKDVWSAMDEPQILNEIWDRQTNVLNMLRDDIDNAVTEIESTIALEFRTHHKGMRYTLNSMENLSAELRELISKYEEGRDVLDFLIENKRS